MCVEMEICVMYEFQKNKQFIRTTENNTILKFDQKNITDTCLDNNKRFNNQYTFRYLPEIKELLLKNEMLTKIVI